MEINYNCLKEIIAKYYIKNKAIYLGAMQLNGYITILKTIIALSFTRNTDNISLNNVETAYKEAERSAKKFVTHGLRYKKYF